MEQHADITFEALPQRIDANKFKRRRRAEAAIPSSADQPSAAAAAAADEGNGDASAEAAAVAGAGGGAGGAAAGFSSGFGLGDIGQQHQEQEASQQQQHIEDAQQYRSAAVGEHKFECECTRPLGACCNTAVWCRSFPSTSTWHGCWRHFKEFVQSWGVMDSSASTQPIHVRKGKITISHRI